MSEQVQEIAVAELHGFKDHPFQVKDDESFQELCDSIQKYGVLSPLLVRDTTNDEAVILMVDSNIQRENLLPSEKAFAYKMKFEALKHQGKAASGQLVPKGAYDRRIAESPRSHALGRRDEQHPHLRRGNRAERDHIRMIAWTSKGSPVLRLPFGV